jgi:hypothetical protein
MFQYLSVITFVHPPRNIIVNIIDINIICTYSPKKNNANVIDEYSTLNPDTNSDSPSGRSNGLLFVSASIEIKNNILVGNKPIRFQPSSCVITITDKL